MVVLAEWNNIMVIFFYMFLVIIKSLVLLKYKYKIYVL